jgi:hypothetical protein
MTEGMRVCSKCHFEKPVSEFSVTDKATGLRRAWCKPCESARVRAYYASNAQYREKAKANSLTQAKAHPERRPAYTRRALLKRKYGLTEQQYDALLAAQGGRCALCGADNHGRTGESGRHDGLRKWLADSWPVDHDHKDGHVRGLICQKCNVRLGAYEGLMAEIGEARVREYLTRPSPVPLPVVAAPDFRLVADLPPRYTPSPICLVEGCGKKSSAQGLCPKHYMRLRRSGDPGTAAPLAHVVPHLSKLTTEQVSAIKASSETGVALAGRYGVTPAQISSIRTGKTWRHVN